jgi:5'-deoxynucleotidase YfbR-like HD superfamily hydrolase
MLIHNTVRSYKNLLRTAFQPYEPDTKTAIAVAIAENVETRLQEKQYNSHINDREDIVKFCYKRMTRI